MKNLIKGLFCLCTVFILGCESEEALPVATQQEEVNFQLGIDKEVFLNRAATRQAVKRLNDNDVGIHFNTINELTPEDLANKLDLNNGYEFTEPHIEGSVIPIKTHGEVKRNFYSYEMNGKLYNYVITYPDPDNWRYYEVSTIDNQLLSVVEVDESGQGDAFYLAASIPDIEYCEQQVYQSCSSGAHSFALGNAEECDYWLYPGEGSPPSVSITLVACEEGGDNPDDAGGWGTDEDGPSSPPVDTDDPPTDGQVCIEGFDCDRGNTNAYENCVNAGNTDCWQFCEQYACSEEDQNRWELAQELNSIMEEGDSWEFDDSLSGEEVLEFETVQDFVEWKNSIVMSEVSFQSYDDNDTHVTAVKGLIWPIPPVYINIEAKSILDADINNGIFEYELLEVVSFFSGINPLLTWDQTSFSGELDSEGNYKIQVYGFYSVGVKVLDQTLGYSGSRSFIMIIDPYDGSLINVANGD
ncbi:MAG: hypothetical protein KTR13_07950 [Saprospiraceae bacterium]|nr:hypothetical protein [Saprospiraceae bacterium]